jgi:UDP-glucose 6-dehydrogenase
MRISVAGIGYVGFVVAGDFAESGNHAICGCKQGGKNARLQS